MKINKEVNDNINVLIRQFVHGVSKEAIQEIFDTLYTDEIQQEMTSTIHDLESRVKGLEDDLELRAPSKEAATAPVEPPPMEGPQSLQRFRYLVKQIVDEVLKQVVSDMWNDVHTGNMKKLQLVQERVHKVEECMNKMVNVIAMCHNNLRTIEDYLSDGEDDQLCELAPPSPQY